MSQQLNKARQYEEIHDALISPDQRPLYHLTPRSGWMNDPNGFCFYGGVYHMFYQYYPYASRWDSMHWGHAVSGDMLHWTALPAALAPDQEYDSYGCFSGSAVTLPDGKHLLMYTGVRRTCAEDGKYIVEQTQNLAVGDGKDYEKYEGNPVLTGEDLPPGCSTVDFRDPKMWRDSEGNFICAVGNRPADGSGQILLYRSSDGFDWTFWKILDENKKRFGRMWECPDFFELDGKHLLLVSPQDMLPDGFEYHNGNGTLCLIGRYEEKTGEFTELSDQAIDYGIDFYAPQTVLMPDGRRVMIGWLQNWDACTIRDPDEPWAGQMSMPRELRIRDGRLYQAPLSEIRNMRTDPVLHQCVLSNEEISIEGVEGRTLELDLTIQPTDPAIIYHKFYLQFAVSDEYHTSLIYKPATGILQLDRKFSGSRRAIVHQRRCLVESEDRTKIHLHVFLDRYSCEVFVNDGKYVMSMNLYTDLSADRIRFGSDGSVRMNLEKYTLR